MSSPTRFTTEDDYQALHAAYDMIRSNAAADTAGASMSLDLGHDLMHERLAVIEDRAYQAALRDVAEKLKGLEDLALATRVLGTVEHMLHLETSCWCGAPRNPAEVDPQQSCSANLWHDTRRDLRVPAAP